MNKELEKYIFRCLDKDNELEELLRKNSNKLIKKCTEVSICSLCSGKREESGISVKLGSKDSMGFLCENCLVIHYQLWEIRNYMRKLLKDVDMSKCEGER